MNVKLILETGSHAGQEAPLQIGYYMVGRHKECQIRPKTHLVSRRHCIIHRLDGALRVFDLGSANGTFVNDEQLEPNQWMRLGDGDRLRCGSAVFQVDVEQAEPVSEAKPASDNGDSAILKGDAWQEFDIVGFLEAEDEVERETRYGAIRAQRISEPDQEDVLDDFDFAPATGPSDTSTDLTAERIGTGAGGQPNSERISETNVPSRSERIAAIRRRLQAEGESHDTSRSNGRQRTSTAEPGQSWRLAAAVLLSCVALVMLAYTTYSTFSGNSTRIVQGID